MGGADIFPQLVQFCAVLDSPPQKQCRYRSNQTLGSDRRHSALVDSHGIPDFFERLHPLPNRGVIHSELARREPFLLFQTKALASLAYKVLPAAS
jgi:hypothetical protein